MSWKYQRLVKDDWFFFSVFNWIRPIYAFTYEVHTNWHVVNSASPKVNRKVMQLSETKPARVRRKTRPHVKNTLKDASAVLEPRLTLKFWVWWIHLISKLYICMYILVGCVADTESSVPTYIYRWLHIALNCIDNCITYIHTYVHSLLLLSERCPVNISTVLT